MDERSFNRFLKYVEISSNGCWIWRGARQQGYGKFRVGTKATSAHRASYEHFVGPITEPQLDHLCRTRACVNPAHLQPVSVAENGRRKPKAEHCKRGHSLAGAPVWNGARHCRECSVLRKRAYRARQRAKRNGYDAPLALVMRQTYTVTLEVRGRAVVSVQADTPDEACAKAAQLDPWDFDVDVTDTTVEGWELDTA